MPKPTLNRHEDRRGWVETYPSQPLRIYTHGILNVEFLSRRLLQRYLLPDTNITTLPYPLGEKYIFYNSLNKNFEVTYITIPTWSILKHIIVSLALVLVLENQRCIYTVFINPSIENILPIYVLLFTNIENNKIIDFIL